MGAAKPSSTCCCKHQTVPNQNNIPHTARFSMQTAPTAWPASTSSQHGTNKWIPKPSAGIPFSSQQPNLSYGTPASLAAGGEPRQPQSRGRGVSLCKPSLSEPGFEVQSSTHVFKQRPRLHSSTGSAAPAMRHSPSRCFQPGQLLHSCLLSGWGSSWEGAELAQHPPRHVLALRG